MAPDEEKAAYREAYDAWQRQLAALHDFLLEGKPPGRGAELAAAVKGLLNREARAKERYDDARRRLIGIDE